MVLIENYNRIEIETLFEILQLEFSQYVESKIDCFHCFEYKLDSEKIEIFTSDGANQLLYSIGLPSPNSAIFISCSHLAASILNLEREVVEILIRSFILDVVQNKEYYS